MLEAPTGATRPGTGASQEKESNMELEQAKSIVKTLAQGVDPTTGEVFAPESPYNDPRVIRALFTVHDLARPAKIPRMSVDERRRHNIESGRPRNSGLPWTDDNREQVASEFRKGKTIAELATTLERSQGAIHAELVKQGLVSPDFR
jgi:hypothetical protein